MRHISPSRLSSLQLSTSLLGSLFLLVACGNDAKKATATEAPEVESVCTDGRDDDLDGQIDCDDSDCASPGGDCVAAPALDRTVASTVAESAAILYTGRNPLQKGADVKAFDAKRLAMLKGLVIDDGGKPLVGVRVSVHGHDEYGYTFSRKDGTYDMAVNGGTKLLLDFTLVGKLDAQRAITPGWQRHHYVGTVGLTAATGETSHVSTDSDQAAAISGRTTTDDYGERQPLVVFQPGTTAEAVLADGSKEPLSTLTVTVTEYPIDGTQQYLPGTPQVTGMAYGLDFAVAEAKELGATHVTFSEPVSIYVENFLELPVGTTMPLGYYDNAKGQWEDGQTGTVIEILDIADGKAAIDANGDGSAEDLSELEAIGITGSDLRLLAQRYERGVQLMQGKVSHFSAYAAQINARAPKGAVSPSPSVLKAVFDHPTRRGNVLVEPRAVVEDIPITGTPYSLTYQSNRTTSYVAGMTLNIPLVPAAVPAGLKRVVARVAIAGKTYEGTYDAKASQKFTVTWDGFDSLNRLLQGPQLAQVYVGYVYNGVLPNGTKPSKPIEVTLGQQVELQVGQWDFKGYELGGFGIDVLHAYNPALRTVCFGNGNQRSAENVALVTKPASSDRNFDLGTPDSLAVQPDGSLLVTDDQQNDVNALGRVLRIAPNGKPSVLYGPGAKGTAGNIKWGQPQGLVVMDDGGIIVADILNGTISKVDPKGKLTLLVSGTRGQNAAVVHQFVKLDGIALGHRQELYIIDSDRLMKLEAGKLSTFAGGGTETTDGAVATNAQFTRLSGLAIDAQGLVIVSDRDGNRIRKILADGTVTTIAGTGTAGFSGDGGNATLAELSSPRGLALGPDGSLYVVDQGNNRIRRITTDGLIQTVIGGGTAAIAVGVLATNVKLDEPDGIAVSPDGTLYVATMSQVLKIYPGLPEMSEKDNLVPSEDGRTLYRFDYRGKHLETLDAVTGVRLLKFGYKDGFLTEISDESGVTTAITRDKNSHLPQTIESQYGQTTSIELSDNGWFAKVTDPISRSYELTWNAVSGRLDSVKDPTQKVGTYRYDLTGRLESVTNPTGYTEQLADLVTANGTAGTTVTTKAGKVTQYTYKPTSGGGLQHSVTAPDSTTTDTTVLPTSRASKTPDGTSILTYLVPDYAFGPQSMVPSETTVTLPSGKKLVTSYQRTKKVDDIGNALSLQEWLEETETNGRVSSSLYSRASKTVTNTSPMGRVTSTTFDDAGHPVRIVANGLPVVDLTYDEDGRVTTVKQTSNGKVRTEARGYGENGWLASRKNALGQSVQYGLDLVGRPATITRPDSKATTFGWNDADNVTSLTTPAGHAHLFSYDATTQLLTTATPPSVSPQSGGGLAAGQKAYSYGTDHELTKIGFADGRSVAFAYGNGRLKSQTLGSATLSYAYDKGLVSRVNRSDSAVTVDLGYDGALPTSSTWSGAISGSVKATYDNNIWLSSLTVNGASTVNYGYDDDGLVTSASCTAGAMSITRDANTGMVTGTSLGNVGTKQTYSGFGELEMLTATASGTGVFGQILERDDLGRVTRIEEQAGAVSHILGYTYDNLGRLATATRDGVTTTYGYDANGNRTSVQTGNSPQITATFDAQDRILTYGTQKYLHSAAGALVLRTDGTIAVSLTYDELGNLMKSILTDGTTSKSIEYVVDGLGRRVGRKVNGTFDKKWLYRDGLRPIAEIDSAGVFTHFVYADSQSGAPDFLIRSGVLYRIVKDHLGSVRMVIDAMTGAIAQTLEYDAFGRVLSETGSGFQPFGFAGGLYDADTKLVRFGARDYDPGMGRWTNKDPIGFAGGDTDLFAYVGNDPVNMVDPSGLADVFRGLDIDLVGILGVEIGVGVVLDTDHLLQSGIYVSGGVSAGANVGVAIQDGIVKRDIEGWGTSVDANVKAFSPVLIMDDQGVNGVAVGVGPGVGLSAAATYTTTLSPEKIIGWVTSLVK